MKVVILAGGYGTRLSEETSLKPKPMVEIGEEPILWHIMKIYSHYGYKDFVICLGYKGNIIKDYFINYHRMHSNLTVDLKSDVITTYDSRSENWNIQLIDTGTEVMTGGRLKRIEKYLDGETFLMTYGDGVSDVNVNDLVAFHRKHNKLVTMTAVKPEGRFGLIRIDKDGSVIDMVEKPPGDGEWVNGGFFVINRKALEYIGGDSTIWERAPLQELTKRLELKAFQHQGFWKPMDTLNDRRTLDTLWNSGKAPWKVWK
jgi:glucose-1-phosphate cytidylyltransferase